jgi:AraC family transcriptional regulator
MPPHTHDTWGISVVLSGKVEELVGATVCTGAAGSLVIKPPGTRHANRFGQSGSRMLSLLVHPEYTEPWFAGATPPTRWGWFDDAATLGIAGRLVARLRGRADGAEAVDTALAALIGLVTAGGRIPSGRPPGWLITVRQRLHAEFATCCRVRDLAEAAGVHPVHLARAYRRYFGRSVSQELQGLRARAAADRLIETDEPVGRVAASLGFADQSHLCRAFGRLVGTPPSTYRKLVRPS